MKKTIFLLFTILSMSSLSTESSKDEIALCPVYSTSDYTYQVGELTIYKDLSAVVESSDGTRGQEHLLRHFKNGLWEIEERSVCYPKECGKPKSVVTVSLYGSSDGQNYFRGEIIGKHSAYGGLSGYVNECEVNF